MFDKNSLLNKFSNIKNEVVDATKNAIKDVADVTQSVADKVSDTGNNSSQNPQPVQNTQQPSVQNEQTNSAPSQEVEMPAQNEQKVEIPQEPEWQAPEWQDVVGEDRTFSLAGITLEIPKKLDIFNTYRKQFRVLADGYANNAKIEYKRTVHDLESFLDNFTKIYSKHLDFIIDVALDVLVSQNIWTISKDDFMQEHLKNFSKAIDALNVTIESIQLTSEKNQKTVSALMSYVPNVSGFGLGLKGAAKAMAGAAAFNLLRDGVEAGLTSGAANLNKAQKEELYNRINVDALFTDVLQDYWRVYRSLIWTLRKNGHDIWWDSADINQQESIFKNLSNPRFPQEKIPEVLVDIIKINPYNVNYYNFMLSHFGKTDEVDALIKYFGY